MDKIEEAETVDNAEIMEKAEKSEKVEVDEAAELVEDGGANAVEDSVNIVLRKLLVSKKYLLCSAILKETLFSWEGLDWYLCFTYSVSGGHGTLIL